MQVPYAGNSLVGWGIRKAFFMLNGSRDNPIDSTQSWVNTLKARRERIKTIDGVFLDAVWIPQSKQEVFHPTVILIHPNGCPWRGMRPHAEWYRGLGFNVFLYTIRGYPGSGGSSVDSGELGFYADADAAMRRVLSKDIPVNKVLAHGMSLGGAAAAWMGTAYKIPVVLDHTFSSAEDMVEQYAGNFAKRNCTSIAFPKGLSMKKDGKPIKRFQENPTDGLNTAEKIRRVGFDAFVLYGNVDKITPTGHKNRLVQAICSRSGKREDEVSSLVPGGHGGAFYWCYDGLKTQPSGDLYRFIKSKGLIVR